MKAIKKNLRLMDHGFPIKAEIKPILNAWAWQKKTLWQKIKFRTCGNSQYMFVTAHPFFVTRLQSTVSNSFQEFKKPQFLHLDVTLTPPNNRGH